MKLKIIDGRQAKPKLASQMRVGDEVYIGDVNGNWAYRRIISIGKEDKYIIIRFDNEQSWLSDGKQREGQANSYYVAISTRKAKP